MERALDLDDVQVGSMFVTDELVRAVLGPAPGRSPTTVLDGVRLDTAWQTAEVRIDVGHLPRWQRNRLLWAPVLRRVRVRLRRPDPQRVAVSVRRRWPR